MTRLFNNCLLFFLLSLPLAAQQEYGLTFLTHLPQAPLQANPATFSDYRLNLVLPNLALGYQNSVFSVGDLFQPASEGGQVFDLDQSIARMRPDQNAIHTSLSVNAAALSFQLKQKLQVSFFHNTQLEMQLLYPKGFPSLLWKGNGAFLGETLEIAPAINFLAYNEYGMGLAARLHEKFTAAVNVKYLNGLVGIRTIQSQASLYTSPEYYQLELESDMVIRTGGMNDILSGEADDPLADQSTSYLLNSGNNGIGFDVGMHIRVADRWAFNLAMQDIGKIYWTRYALENTSQGTYTYEGQQIRPFADGQESVDFGATADSVGALFDFRSSAKPFYTPLPQRFSLLVRFDPFRRFSVGGGFHYASWNGVNQIAATAHAQKQIGRILYFGTVAGYHQQTAFFLGANATLQLGPLQFFAISDNILALIDPLNGQFANLRAGLNLAFLPKKESASVVEPVYPNERYYFKGED
ncbi:MAG: hypothetical protein RLY31_205 [Bacteroidota bacterium]|jgi:hypothetical protein